MARKAAEKKREGKKDGNEKKGSKAVMRRRTYENSPYAKLVAARR